MILLGVLCGICGLLLAFVNSVTAPIIEKASMAAEYSNLEAFFPGASFSEIKDYDDPTGLVTGVYEAEGQGMIYKVHSMGYDSEGFTFLIAYNNDGTVAGYTVLEHHETDGLGKRCFEEDYTAEIMKISASQEAPLLSGATLTSTGVHDGIEAARTLFIAKNGGTAPAPSAPAEKTEEEQPEEPVSKALKDEDLSSAGAVCEEKENDGTTVIYACKAKGFNPDNEAEVTVDLSAGTITAFEVTNAADDKDGVGDDAYEADNIARYIGITSDSEVDAVSGATETSKALRAMAQAALAEAGK